MLGWADSNWLRIVGYVVVVILTAAAARRELRDFSRTPTSWPTFWVLTSGLLIVMAIGRAMEVGDFAGDAFRDTAVDQGWYESRRPLQVVAGGLLVIVWLVVVLGSVWKVPARRRRYLPMIVATVSMVVFALVRMVSLRQIDSLLHRRQLLGARVATVIELFILASAAVCTIWAMRSRRDPDQRADAHASRERDT